MVESGFHAINPPIKRNPNGTTTRATARAIFDRWAKPATNAGKATSTRTRAQVRVSGTHRRPRSKANAGPAAKSGFTGLLGAGSGFAEIFLDKTNSTSSRSLVSSSASVRNIDNDACAASVCARQAASPCAASSPYNIDARLFSFSSRRAFRYALRDLFGARISGSLAVGERTGQPVRRVGVQVGAQLVRGDLKIDRASNAQNVLRRNARLRPLRDVLLFCANTLSKRRLASSNAYGFFECIHAANLQP